MYLQVDTAMTAVSAGRGKLYLLFSLSKIQYISFIEQSYILLVLLKKSPKEF